MAQTDLAVRVGDVQSGGKTEVGCDGGTFVFDPKQKWGRITYEMMESYWPAVASAEQPQRPQRPLLTLNGLARPVSRCPLIGVERN
jgi:hypothetical protein